MVRKTPRPKESAAKKAAPKKAAPKKAAPKKAAPKKAAPKKAAKKAAPRVRLEPGTVYAVPTPDGRFTAYQIVRDDAKSPYVVALDWLGDAPPSLETLASVGILRKTSYAWNDAPDACYVGSALPPSLWSRLGVLPVPTFQGPESYAGDWPTGASILSQRRWDETIPEATRRAYKTRYPNDPLRLDLGGTVLEDVTRNAWRIMIGSEREPVREVRWSELEVLPKLTDLTVFGDPPGLEEFIASRPLLSVLAWRAHGRSLIDLRTSHFHELMVDVREPLRLQLSDSMEDVAVTGGAELTVVSRDEGRRLSLRLHETSRLPSGLAALQSLTVSSSRELDVDAVARAFPSLRSLTIFGEGMRLRSIGALARLPLADLTLHACYDLDVTELPHASEMPALERVDISGFRRSCARELELRFGHVPTFELNGGKTDVWLAANLDNPFRDWVERDPRQAKVAVGAWRTAVGAISREAPKRANEAALRAFVETFNRLDEKHGLDTVDREEVLEAFCKLVGRTDLDVEALVTSFDAWRTF